MKFKITRTTSWSGPDEKRPCDEAFKDKFIETHTINKDEYGAWFIELKTLEELISFLDKYGDFAGIIIDRANCNRNVVEIEIYDDYRE